MGKYYIAFFWILSYLCYYLYGIKKKRIELMYLEKIKLYSDSKYISFKVIHKIIKNSDDPNLVKSVKTLQFLLYLSFLFSLIPVIIFVIQIIWS